MSLSLLSHLLCAWFAFALPSYATYKALAHAAPADTLHALSAYWAVVGAFVAFEQTFGLLLSWLPFYWELRTIFLLYVSLPQIQGSAYVYSTYVEPWCSSNEADLDAAMASAQSNTIAFCRARVTALADLVWSLLNRSPVSAHVPRSGGAHKPPYSVDRLRDLWTTYSPTALALKDSSGGRVSSSSDGELHATN